MLRIIRGVDLIAASARYHSGCRSQYVDSRSANQSASHREDVYTRAFDGLVREIKIEFDSGKVLDMTSLLLRVQCTWTTASSGVVDRANPATMV